jgi:hypothetical protein
MILNGHAGQLNTAVFSPDGRRVVTASEDRTARIWDVETGKTIVVLRGHTGRVYTASFSRDGGRVLTASEDNTARIWDGQSGQVVTVLSGIAGGRTEVYAAAYNSDGSRIAVIMVSDEYDYFARVWPAFANTQELVNDAKRAIPRCLTRLQRQRFFLDPEPPAWCIDMEKWPYQSQDWKDWLRFKRANANPPLPITREWQPWIAARDGAQSTPKPPAR